MPAKFKVIYIDPEGSGMDWSGHLGMIVVNAKRCCNNCSIIFGETESGKTLAFGPFTFEELEPLNDEAVEIHKLIKDKC